jgi:hypothetical protein
MLKAELWDRIRAAQPSPAQRIFGWIRLPIAIPVAAAIALAAYFGPGLLGSHPPMIEAAYYLQDHAALNSTVPFNDHGTTNPVDLETAAIVNTQQTAVNIDSATTYTADANR